MSTDTNKISLECHIFLNSEGEICLLIEPYFICIDERDIISITAIETISEGTRSFSMQVRIEMQKGFAVRAIRHAGNLLQSLGLKQRLLVQKVALARYESNRERQQDGIYETKERDFLNQVFVDSISTVKEFHQ